VAVYYLDTSAVVKRYVAEVGTTWVSALCQPTAGNTLNVTRITGAELIAALFRRVQVGSLTPTERRSPPRGFAAIGAANMNSSKSPKASSTPRCVSLKLTPCAAMMQSNWPRRLNYKRYARPSPCRPSRSSAPMADSTPLPRQKGCRSKTPTFILKFRLIGILVGHVLDEEQDQHIVLILRSVHLAAPRNSSQDFQRELYNSLFLMA